jgi:hypothetical protein
MIYIGWFILGVVVSSAYWLYRMHSLMSGLTEETKKILACKTREELEQVKRELGVIG